MPSRPLSAALADEVLTLDGGLATRLEARGHDLSDSLWSARLLLDDPDEVRAAHRDFVDAGARVVIGASYQVTFDGFADAGLDSAATEDALRRSVDLARAATDVGDGTDRWVAASVGPYAASLADGSEYVGDPGRTIRQLRTWHRPRLAVLAESGAADRAWAPMGRGAAAAALLAEVSGTGIPVWLSMTCTGDRLRSGEDPDEAWQLAREVREVVAVGVNCTPPGDVEELVARAVDVSRKPGIAYPNSGEDWDARTRTWAGEHRLDADDVRAWVGVGARLVGGCCRVGPDEIRDVAAAITTA